MTSIFYFVQCVTKQCITKQIIRFSACDIQYGRGLGGGFQPRPSALAENPYLDLDYSGNHKNLIQ